MKLPLSVAVISFNEEAKIGNMLKSVSKIASEIIVVDSHSTDSTKEIAESFGAKFFSEDWKGHISQKNSAIEKCSYEWILSLDCDEVPDEELIKSISKAVNSGDHDGYILNRKTIYLGKILNYAWQPDRNIRLVKKSSNPVWTGLDPHDKLKIDGSKGSLKGTLLHYSYDSIEHHLSKTIDYAKISAKAYLDNGRKFSFFNLLFNPPFAFIRSYFIRRAALDGVRGLITSLSSFIYTFLKYIYLWDFSKNKK